MEHFATGFVYHAGWSSDQIPRQGTERETMRNIRRLLLFSLSTCVWLPTWNATAWSQVQAQVAQPNPFAQFLRRRTGVPQHVNDLGPGVGTPFRSPWHLPGGATRSLPFHLLDGDEYPWQIHQYGF
jgi:hypothetical protein